MRAALAGDHQEVARFLLERGADVDAEHCIASLCPEGSCRAHVAVTRFWSKPGRAQESSQG